MATELKIEIRKPDYFMFLNKDVMSNFDHIIDKDVAKKIKREDYYAQYSGCNFCGYVWWQNNKWHCEVWRYRSFVETISENTLEEIMSSVSDQYGND